MRICDWSSDVCSCDLALVVLLIIYPADPSSLGLPSFPTATLVLGLLMTLVGLGTFVAVWVYLQNQFYLTNESVIQEIQHSLFSRREQTRSEEHTSELQSLMRISYAVFCLKKKK